MCGIAGFFHLKGRGAPPDAETIVADQISSLRHRGPDAQAVHVAPGLGLGHARLSIIDLSARANQPMFDASGRVAIVFNGEIYNFRELRRELESLGHRFRTKCDTEVIVEGYLEWDIDVLDHLRGMFALALYDAERDRLVLMRDRVGKKPLYYTVHGGMLVFASEIKAILRYPGIPRLPDYSAIHEYLTFQYVPSPKTGFAGIHKLPHSHLLIASRGKDLSIRRYYSLPGPANARRRPHEQLCAELVALLRESTRLRTISDVPLGAFLSGGVDSSSVVAMMALSSPSPIKTFTIGFEEKDYDERQYARAVAQRYGTDHHELIVPAGDLRILDRIVYHYGEPFADPSAVPTYYLSQLASDHVTVALSGDGGDESFFGYSRYRYCRGFDTAPHLPRWITKPLQAMLLALPRGLERHKRVKRLRRALGIRNARRSRDYEPAIAFFSDDSKRDLYAGSMRDLLAGSALDRLDRYLDQAQSMAQAAAWADTHTYLPDDILVKMDVASMAHSLEVRCPLLDHKLMEWAVTVPEDQRFSGRETKSLFKKALEPYLPREVLYRSKMGFGAPIDVWLRGDMREFAYDVLLDQTARQRGLFDMTHVRGMLDTQARQRKRGLTDRIWALLMLELWFRMWIDPAESIAVPLQCKHVARRETSPH